MIADYIRNTALYHGLGPGLGKALRYLAETDFSNSTPGRVVWTEICLRRYFAIHHQVRFRCQVGGAQKVH